MADEEKTVVQESAEEGTPVKESSSMMKYIIMAGIVVVMAVAGYFVTLKVIKPMVSGDDASEMSDSGEDSGGDTHAESSKKKKKASKSHEDGEAEVTHIFTVKDIIVNPAGTGGTRFLSASIGFEVEYESTIELFKNRQPQIRDALITILGSKNIEQLTDMRQKEIARLQIKKRVESLLDTDELSAVYFTDFVIQ